MFPHQKGIWAMAGEIAVVCLICKDQEADASFRFQGLVRKFYSVTSLVLSCIQCGIGAGH